MGAWCRLLDGRLAWADRGRGGAGEDGKVKLFTDFILPDGSHLYSVDESEGPKRMAVEWPRAGEWWALRHCREHDSSPTSVRYSRKADQFPKDEISARMKCGCLSPDFEPWALKGPTGPQG